MNDLTVITLKNVIIIIIIIIIIVIIIIIIIIIIIADDKRSPESQFPSCYYLCVLCMQPAFVWTSTKNVWNAQNAL